MIKSAWSYVFGPTSPTPVAKDMTITKTVSASTDSIQVSFSSGGKIFELKISGITFTATTTTSPTK